MKGVHCTDILGSVAKVGIGNSYKQLVYAYVREEIDSGSDDELTVKTDHRVVLKNAKSHAKSHNWYDVLYRHTVYKEIRKYIEQQGFDFCLAVAEDDMKTMRHISNRNPEFRTPEKDRSRTRVGPSGSASGAGTEPAQDAPVKDDGNEMLPQQPPQGLSLPVGPNIEEPRNEEEKPSEQEPNRKRTRSTRQQTRRKQNRSKTSNNNEQT